MSIQSEINRINNNVQATLQTIADTGVNVGNNSNALPAAAAALANEKASIDHSHTASEVGAAAAKIGVVTVTVSTTLALIHAEKTLRVNSASAVTLTVPTNASVAFPVGTCIVVTSVGAGTVSFTPASGVTLNSKDGKRSIDGQYAAVTLYKSDTNVWELWGALA